MLLTPGQAGIISFYSWLLKEMKMQVETNISVSDVNQ